MPDNGFRDRDGSCVAALQGFDFATRVLYGRSVERRMDFGGNRWVMNQDVLRVLVIL